MSPSPIKNSADLVVYGKVFTAENNKIAEAFAVKDGKYIYVGDKLGAEAKPTATYFEGKKVFSI